MSHTVFLDFDVGGPVDVVQPRVVNISALTSKSIEIGFSEKMKNNAALKDVSNYFLDDPTVPIIAAQQYGDYKVRLIVGEMLDGKSYRVTVSNVEDREGNVLDPAYTSKTFLGVGSLPELIDVQVISSRRIRLFFNEPMTKNAALTNVFNYAVVPTGSGSPVNVGDVEPENQTYPKFVDLITTEMTDGAGYDAIAVNVADIAGNVIGPSNTFNFTGEGEPPVVLRLEAISKNRVDVVFDEPILDNAFARDPGNFIWTGGLTTISVLDVVGARIKLVTSDQTPGALYDLVIG